jgi:hypothetical protein
MDRAFDLNRAENALAARDAPALRAALLDLCPATSDQGNLDALICFALDDRIAPSAIEGADDAFVASIASMRGPDRVSGCHHRIIGEALDFLGELDDPTSWTPAQWLNLLMLGQIRAPSRAAVVGTMRDDGIYVLEWIAHYRALGLKHLFIYTNDNMDGSEALLRQLAELKIITLIESHTSGRVRPEVKAFNHAVHLLRDLRDYEWVLFVDSDEFFVPSQQYSTVTDLLDALEHRYPDGSAAAIAYQWLWYNSAMILQREPGTLAERFQYATPHWLTKSLVRLRDVVSMRRQHIPDLRAGRIIVDSAFDPFDAGDPWEDWKIQYAGGRVNHYWPKSFEEFSLKKARGEALKLADNEYARDFRLFFEWNGPDTPETHRPVDPAFLDRVRRGMAEMRAMPGVAACEAEVERRFRELLRRYDDAGGLRRIYTSVKA